MISSNKFLVLFIYVSLAIITQYVVIAEDSSTQQPQPIKTSDRSEYKKSISRDCATSYSLTCLKLDVVSWVDKLNENENYAILPGVSLVREEKSDKSVNTAELVSELAREFPSDPDARLDAFLVKKVTGFLHSHSVKLDLLSAKDLASARSYGVETGRKGGGGGGGGKKGGGGLGMILAAAAMMKGTLAALALGGLAAIAGKALMTALISLLLSAIIGLKSLTSGGGKETTVEVVAKPIYSHSHSHSEDHGGHGRTGYARNLEMMPLPLGLRPDYKPA